MIEPHGGDWGDQHVLALIGRGRDTEKRMQRAQWPHEQLVAWIDLPA